jgi:hypothetical protein
VYGIATSTLSASSPLTGSLTQLGSGGSLGIQAGGTSQNGYISSTDWNTFNGKLNLSNLWNISTTYGTTTRATTTPEWFMTGLFASSTSQLTYASTTALSATTICLTGDSCRTTWPTGGGGGGDPFTHTSAYGQTTSASSTLLALTGSPFSLVASSTAEFVYASTTDLTVFTDEWHPGITASRILALDNTGKLVATTSIGVNYLAGIPTGANPTASVGLSAVNGSGTSYMLANAAPALDQTISPTMTGAWAFNGAASTTVANGLYAKTIAAQYFMATSTTASTFPYASTTALTSTTLCLTGDTCRTTWPSGGAGVWPFTTTDTNFGATPQQSTTTPEWFKGNGRWGLFASSTSVFDYASTTQLSAVSLCLTGDTCRTTWPSGSVSGGTTGMLASWTDSTTLTATSGPTAAYFYATSTTNSVFPALRDGEIAIQHSNGSWSFTIATTSSDIGRGTALLTAVSAAASGDSIYLPQNTFDLGSGCIDLSIGGAGTLNLHGAGKYETVITSTCGGGGKVIIRPGTNSETTDLEIAGSSGNQPWGSGSANTTVFTNALLKNVYIVAGIDAVYHGPGGPNGITETLINVTASTSWDTLRDVGASDVINVYDSSFIAKQNAGLSQTIRGMSSFGTINSYNNIVSATGGSTENDGYDCAGTCNIYGGTITTSGSGQVKDIFNDASTYILVTSDTSWDYTKGSTQVNYVGVATTTKNLYTIAVPFQVSNTATSTFAGGVQINGGLNLASGISGFLKAVAGVVTTALVNLASDVTGTLPAGNGGTGGTSLSPGFSVVSNVFSDVEYRVLPQYGTSTVAGTAGSNWVGTTTYMIDQVIGAETYNGFKCKTDQGTLNIQFGSGTASTTMYNASTTNNFNTLNSNNTPSSGTYFLTIGTPASSVRNIQCTLKVTI